MPAPTTMTSDSSMAGFHGLKIWLEMGDLTEILRWWNSMTWMCWATPTFWKTSICRRSNLLNPVSKACDLKSVKLSANYSHRAWGSWKKTRDTSPSRWSRAKSWPSEAGCWNNDRKKHCLLVPCPFWYPPESQPPVSGIVVSHQMVWLVLTDMSNYINTTLYCLVIQVNATVARD